MAEPGFTIEIDDSRLKAVLKKLDKKVRNLKPAMEEVGEILLTSITKNFEVGGRFNRPGDFRGGSSKWQPLSPATLKRKRGSKILIQSTNLLNSINARADRDSVEVGSNRVYAAIHQFGGKAGPGRKVTIPARPYLVVQNEDLDEMVDSLEEFILGKI